MPIRNNLREIRMKEFDIDNKSEFARFLDVGVKTYQNWETGLSNPTLEGSLKIAKKLNKKVEDIWNLSE